MNPTQFRTPNPDVPFLEVRMGVGSSFSGCKAAAHENKCTANATNTDSEKKNREK